MKSSLLFGAALAATAFAGAAHAQSMGHIDLTFQNNDYGSDSYNDASIGGAALLGEHFQLSGRYANIDVGDTGADYFDIDGFLFSRSDTGAYGGYLSYDNVEDTNEWSIGGFIQSYSDNWNWTAQLGYADTEGDAQNINLDGEGRYFFSDNFSVQGNLGYGTFEGEASGDYFSGGLGAEIGFDNSPISLFGAWEHYEFDSNGVDTFGIGARWSFGGGSVKERSRTGASFQRVTRTLGDLELGGSNAPRG